MRPALALTLATTLLASPAGAKCLESRVPQGAMPAYASELAQICREEGLEEFLAYTATTGSVRTSSVREEGKVMPDLEKHDALYALEEPLAIGHCHTIPDDEAGNPDHLNRMPSWGDVYGMVWRIADKYEQGRSFAQTEIVASYVVGDGTRTIEFRPSAALEEEIRNVASDISGVGEIARREADRYDAMYDTYLLGALDRGISVDDILLGLFMAIVNQDLISGLEIVDVEGNAHCQDPFSSPAARDEYYRALED